VDGVPLNVRLPRELHARLKSRAALRGKTIREYVTEAVAEVVARHEAEDREAGRG
jgi:predicted HicB family RNase H-like nuclease